MTIIDQVVPVVTIVAAGYVTYAFGKLQGKEQNQVTVSTMCVSLAAEMESVLQIAEARKWISEHRRTIEGLRGAEGMECKRRLKLDAKVEKASFPPFAIYDHYVPNIGLAGALASDVVGFYTEFRMLQASYESFSSEILIEELTPSELADHYQAILISLEAALSKAKTTISELRKRARGRS